MPGANGIDEEDLKDLADGSDSEGTHPSSRHTGGVPILDKQKKIVSAILSQFHG